MIEQWQQHILSAADSGKKLQLRGGSSKDFYGQPPVGEVLDTRDHSGVVDYEPTELVVTVRCGTPLAELEATLANEGQMLAFEPPHFGNATVGGCVAAGLSGPRRARVGSLRDFVLGANLLDGNANHLELGGQVMKNVAGYDVSRFLAGSLGILGIITEVSLKVLPLPELEKTVLLNLTQDEALNKMSNWAAKPLPISAKTWHNDQLHIRLSGAASAVEAAAQQIGGEHLDLEQAKTFWQKVKEHQHSFFKQDDKPLWRIALPAATPSISDDNFLEWNGTQRWLRTEQPANKLRDKAKALGGHATLFRGGDKSEGVFTPLNPVLQTLHQNLKNEFDPKGIFNPGRMYPEL